MHISRHKREEEKTSVSNSELTRILSPDSKEESTAPRAKPQERMPGIEMQACDTEWDSEEIKEGERELNRRSCARDRPSTDPARGGGNFLMPSLHREESWPARDGTDDGGIRSSASQHKNHNLFPYETEWTLQDPSYYKVKKIIPIKPNFLGPKIVQYELFCPIQARRRDVHPVFERQGPGCSGSSAIGTMASCPYPQQGSIPFPKKKSKSRFQLLRKFSIFV